MTPSGPFMYSMIRSIDQAEEHRGQDTALWDTSDEVLKRSENCWTDSDPCSSVGVKISYETEEGVSGGHLYPTYGASHRADLSTELKVVFMSTYATCRGPIELVVKLNQ